MKTNKQIKLSHSRLIVIVVAVFLLLTTATTYGATAKAYKDTSHLAIQDSISASCPNLPNAKHYSKGQAFWSDYKQYDSTSMVAVEKWVNDYPAEATKFSKLVTAFLDATNPTTLSYTQLGIYYDIKAQMIVVKHENY